MKVIAVQQKLNRRLACLPYSANLKYVDLTLTCSMKVETNQMVD